MKLNRLFLQPILLVLTLSACGSAKVKFAEPTSSVPTTPTVASAPAPVVSDPVGTDLNVELPEGDPARGDLLFHGKVNGQFPCSACHSLQPGQTLVGPSLGEIATTAATRIDGYSAEQYIHESIVSPNAYTVEGFSQNIMPVTFGEQMSKQDLADLIAFLMTHR
jgi:cytochrome c2